MPMQTFLPYLKAMNVIENVWFYNQFDYSLIIQMTLIEAVPVSF